MFETMYAAPGIGLAATQVDVHQRVLVRDVSAERTEPLAFDQPARSSSAKAAIEAEEGCLSVPGVYDTAVDTRPTRIIVRALDRDGQPFEIDADGLLAVCIQHEIDHLEGKLFVDYLSELKRTASARSSRRSGASDDRRADDRSSVPVSERTGRRIVASRGQFRPTPLRIVFAGTPPVRGAGARCARTPRDTRSSRSTRSPIARPAAAAS